MMLAITLVYYWSKSGDQAPEKYSAVNTEVGISRNTKCAIWNGFPKCSHICYQILENNSKKSGVFLHAFNYISIHVNYFQNIS